MPNVYDVGDVARIMATFTNSAGVAVDPSSVYVWHRILNPALSDVTTLGYGVNSVVRASAGVYYTDVAVNSGGEWRYRWRGYGDNAGAVEGKFMALFPAVGG